MTAVKNRLFLLTLLFGLALAIASGCGKSDDTSVSADKMVPPADRKAPKTTSMDGAEIFAQNCSRCHGDKGAGGKRAPVLAGKHDMDADIAKVVTAGKGRMPSFKAQLSADQISSVAKYVSSL